MTEQDETLSNALSDCARGSQQAFLVIHETTSEPLFHLVRKIVGEDHAAADVLQRGYLKIWQSAGSFCDGKGRPITWMSVIMRNLAIDEWRRQKRHQSDTHVCEQVADTALCAERGTEISMLRRRIEDALHQLPPRLEFVVRRRYLQGQSSERISQEMEISAHTVRCWLRRGLARMKQSFPAETLNLAMTLS